MDEPKALIGRYRFQQLLPGAAKNAVWMARDEQTGQRVVVGSMPIPRARALVNLVGFEQPHVARVLHVLDDAARDELPRGVTLGSHALLVVEHISGRSLAQRIETASVPLARAVTWAMRAARALTEVHARGAVLGAISPRSVIVVRDGVIPAFSHLPASPSGAFCSPARVQGGGPSPEDDVWALHAVLYVALTRSQPFRGASRKELADAILNGRYAELGERGIDDPVLSEIVRRGLHPSRPRSSAAELEQELLAWIKLGADVEGLRPRASTPPPPAAAVDAPPGDSQTPSRAHRALPTTAGVSGQHQRIGRADEPTAPALPADVQALANAQAARQLQRDEAQSGHQFSPQASPDKAHLRSSATWDDRTAPALPEDIARLAAAHAALAAGEASGQPSDEPSTDSASALEAPHTPANTERPRFGESDAEEATARFTESDIESLGLRNVQTGEATSRSEPTAAAHPPTIVINEPPPRASMDTLPPGSDPLRSADMITAVRPAAQPPRLKQDSRPDANPPATGRRSLVVLAVAALVAVALVSVWFLRGTRAAQDRDSAPRANNTSSSGTPAAGTIGPASSQPTGRPAAPRPTPSAASSAVAQASAPASIPAAECVPKYFPEETFAPGSSDFSFICEQADPRQSAKTMHRQIVVGGRGKISAGMREWSLMAWYELGVVAVLQHECCPSTKPDLPASAGCDPIADSLTAVASSVDDADATKLEGDIVCLYDKQAPRPYRYGARPDSGNKTAFLAFLKRARDVRAAR